MTQVPALPKRRSAKKQPKNLPSQKRRKRKPAAKRSQKRPPRRSPERKKARKHPKSRPLKKPGHKAGAAPTRVTDHDPARRQRAAAIYTEIGRASCREREKV